MHHSNSNTSIFGMIFSLSFWLTILVSCSLLGLVYLAPKIVAHEKLADDYHRNQVRLIEKQNRVEHFKSVADALQTDPQFRKEMQRVELGIADSQTESIPMESSLQLHANRSVERSAPQRVESWYLRHIVPFANDSSYRQWSLIFAWGSMFFAFVLLQDSGSEQTGRKLRFLSSGVGKMLTRYRRV